MINKRWKRAAVYILCIVMLTITPAGCGNGDGFGTKVVLTTGFEKDEIFRIETSSCKLPELMVYLTTIQNRYESVYGQEIWETIADGVTLEENVKNIALAQIAQIKTMNLMAQKYEVELDEEERARAENAAKAYYDTLGEREIELMGVNEKTIKSLYTELARAEKMYQYTIKDINPEISDDEARTITVQHILIKTYALDGTGKKIEYTEEAKRDAYRRAIEALGQARESEDFDALIRKYSEDVSQPIPLEKGRWRSPLRRRLSIWERARSVTWWRRSLAITSSSASTPLTGRRRTQTRSRSWSRDVRRRSGRSTMPTWRR